MNRSAIMQTLQVHVPKLLAIYAFGSRISGTARPDSDLDLAVLRCVAQGGWIEAALADSLKRMVGFRHSQ
ncbi:MAG: nucleotidyltransferase family protein [Porticoccaceae bacterium]